MRPYGACSEWQATVSSWRFPELEGEPEEEARQMRKSLRIALAELRAIKAILSGPPPQQETEPEKERPWRKRGKPE